MIRVNLLPRPKEDVRIFGLRFDAEYLRQAMAGAALVLFVATMGFAIERIRIERLQTQLAETDRSLAARSVERSEVKRLSLDLARLQAFERERVLFRQSGEVAALSVVRIGNAVPAAMWLDSLDDGATGFTMTGRANSLDSIGTALVAFGSAFPHGVPDLVSIDSVADAPARLRFSARIASETFGKP